MTNPLFPFSCPAKRIGTHSAAISICKVSLVPCIRW